GRENKNSKSRNNAYKQNQYTLTPTEKHLRFTRGHKTWLQDSHLCSQTKSGGHLGRRSEIFRRPHTRDNFRTTCISPSNRTVSFVAWRPICLPTIRPAPPLRSW